MGVRTGHRVGHPSCRSGRGLTQHHVVEIAAPPPDPVERVEGRGGFTASSAHQTVGDVAVDEPRELRHDDDVIEGAQEVAPRSGRLVPPGPRVAELESRMAGDLHGHDEST